MLLSELRATCPHLSYCFRCSTRRHISAALQATREIEWLGHPSGKVRRRSCRLPDFFPCSRALPGQPAGTLWAAIREQGRPAVSDFAAFIREFKTVFDHLDQGRCSSQRLLQLQQGAGSVADYAIEFRILAASSGWNNAALLPVFRRGLLEGLQLELQRRGDASA